MTVQIDAEEGRTAPPARAHKTFKPKRTQEQTYVWWEAETATSSDAATALKVEPPYLQDSEGHERRNN
jgi:hypothetical protein